jgi:hypothetical protein
MEAVAIERPLIIRNKNAITERFFAIFGAFCSSKFGDGERKKRSLGSLENEENVPNSGPIW